MAQMVKGVVLPASWTGDKDRMLEKHIGYAGQVYRDRRPEMYDKFVTA